LAEAGAPERAPSPTGGLVDGAPSAGAAPVVAAAVAELRRDRVSEVRETNPSLRNRRYRVVPL
ncbi:MAG: hydrolase, partial [Actinotalea sp.]|nr:hydrolase [Actinotalea sp.]